MAGELARHAEGGGEEFRQQGGKLLFLRRRGVAAQQVRIDLRPETAGADQRQAGDALRHAQRDERGNGAAHGVARQVHLFQFQRVQRLADRLGRDAGIADARPANGRAVTRQIKGDAAQAGGKAGLDVQPALAVTAKAMQQHQGCTGLVRALLGIGQMGGDIGLQADGHGGFPALDKFASR